MISGIKKRESQGVVGTLDADIVEGCAWVVLKQKPFVCFFFWGGPEWCSQFACGRVEQRFSVRSKDLS